MDEYITDTGGLETGARLIARSEAQGSGVSLAVTAALQRAAEGMSGEGAAAAARELARQWARELTALEGTGVTLGRRVDGAARAYDGAEAAVVSTMRRS